MLELFAAWSMIRTLFTKPSRFTALVTSFEFTDTGDVPRGA